MEDYKKIYATTRISKEADNKVFETLSNLPSRKKIKRFNIVAATFVLVCISSIFLGTMYPAKAHSLFNSVFGYFTKENRNYDKYANVINKTVTKNGVELTINSVVSDSLGLTLGYSFKIDKDIKGGNLVISKVLIDGKKVDFDNGSNFYNEISNRSYVGYENLKVKNLPGKFKLDFIVSDVGDITGEWDFKLDTSNKEINKNTIIINPDVEKTSKDGSIKVSKIISTPLNTYIDLIYKSSEPIKTEDKIQNAPVIMLDQNNRLVNVDGVNNTMIDEYNYHTEFYLKEDKAMINKLTIIPFKQAAISKEARKIEDDNEIYGLKTKTPFIIDGGNLGSITINSIIETQSNIKINCSTDSIYGDMLINSLGLGNNIKVDAVTDNFNPIYFSKKTKTDLTNTELEFDKEPGLKEDKYSMLFQKYIKNIKIYKDLAITIKLLN